MEDQEDFVQQIIPENVQREARRIKAMMEKSAARFEMRNRATYMTCFLMLLAAAVFDILQGLFDLIPYAGWIMSSVVGIYAWFTFYIWTGTLGWNVGDTAVKQTLKWVGVTEKYMNYCRKYLFPIVSFIPLINAFPEQIFGVLFSILMIKSQDFIYNKTKGNVDEEVIVEGIQFFNLLRDVYEV